MKYAVTLGLLVVLVLLGAFAVMWFDPVARAGREADAARNQATEELLLPLKQDVLLVLTGAGGALAVALMAAAGIAALGWSMGFARNRWLLSKLTFAQRGMYAAIISHAGSSERLITPGVHAERTATAQAIFDGNVAKLYGSASRHAFQPEEALAQLPAPAPAELDPAQLIRPDPRENPDTLVVGKKGSGKTNVLRYILGRYVNAMPDAQFLIMSTVAHNWGTLGAISEPEQIYNAMCAINDEMRERDKTMIEAKVTDYHKWPDAPPSTVVLIDEGEDVADKIARVNRKMAADFGRVMRSNINTGRNFGFMFIVGTQTARTDVMDPAFMHNAAHVLMMRMDGDTAARFKVYDPGMTAQLSNLPTGRAYNPKGGGGWVSFPMVNSLPQPRMSGIYRPRLAPPGEDVIEAKYSIAPGASGVLPGATGVLPEQASSASKALPEVLSGAGRGSDAELVAYAQVLLPVALDERSVLTEEQDRLIWELLLRTNRPGSKLYSISAVQEKLWPEISRGGQKFVVLDRAIQREAAKRGLGVQALPGRGIVFKRLRAAGGER